VRRPWRKTWFRLVVYAVTLVVTVFLTVAFTAPRLPNDTGPLPTLQGIQTASRVDPLLGKVASRFAGKRVEVRCWSHRDWARLSKQVAAYMNGHFRPGAWTGYESTDHRRENLAPNVCATLERLTYSHAVPTSYAEGSWLAWSLWILLDVAAQLRHDAPTATCYAMQEITPAGIELGLDRVTAPALGALFWRDIYPHLAGPRRSPECRAGGRLDLHPEKPGWP